MAGQYSGKNGWLQTFWRLVVFVVRNLRVIILILFYFSLFFDQSDCGAFPFDRWDRWTFYRYLFTYNDNGQSINPPPIRPREQVARWRPPPGQSPRLVVPFLEVFFYGRTLRVTAGEVTLRWCSFTGKMNYVYPWRTWVSLFPPSLLTPAVEIWNW